MIEYYDDQREAGRVAAVRDEMRREIWCPLINSSCRLSCESYVGGEVKQDGKKWMVYGGHCGSPMTHFPDNRLEIKPL